MKMIYFGIPQSSRHSTALMAPQLPRSAGLEHDTHAGNLYQQEIAFRKQGILHSRTL